MRRKRVLITPEVLLRLTRGDFRVVTNPLPDTAMLRGCFYDHQVGAIALVLEDASFEDVSDGQLIPIAPGPTIMRL